MEETEFLMSDNQLSEINAKRKPNQPLTWRPHLDEVPNKKRRGHNTTVHKSRNRTTKNNRKGACKPTDTPSPQAAESLRDPPDLVGRSKVKSPNVAVD